MDIRALQETLTRHGFPTGGVDGVAGRQTTAAVKRYQRAYAGAVPHLPRLADDGVPGPLTLRALGALPKLSPHFTVAECRSKGDGTCYVARALLEALEVLRAQLAPGGLGVRSVYRDLAHNRRVGGASASMHLHGLAADLDTWLPANRVRALRVFSGIGTKGERALHVDLRHLAGAANRTPGATPLAPVTWTY